MKLSLNARSVHKNSKRRHLFYENLETRLPFAVGGLASADPAHNQDPNSYPSFANVNLPKLHSNPSAAAVLYLWFEGGIQENGYYFYPSDYETKGTSTTSRAVATGTGVTFQTQAGLPFQVGNRIHIHDNAMSGPLFNGNATESLNFMNAIVTGYSGTTLTVDIDVANGSGTISDWTITNTTFNEAERENIVEIWRQTSKAFSIFNVDVTTDWIDLATKPASLAGVRSTGNGGSTMSDFGTGHTLININATDIQRYAGWVLPHEFGHTLSLTHQANYNSVGLVTAEYGLSFNTFSLMMMGNRDDGNANPHMMKWSNNQPDNSFTTLQDDISKIADWLDNFIAQPYRTTEPDFSADFSNTTAGAATLTDLGGNDYGRAGIINSLTDVDYFTFTTTVDGYVDIMVAHDVYGADFTLQVESATNIIATEDGDTTVSSATRNVYDQHVSLFLPIGTYKIRVASHGNYGDVGPYVVRASRTGTTSIPWRSEDVGFVGTSGFSQNTNSQTYTLSGSGADFGQDNNIMNGYHFMSQTLRGDGEIVAKVTGVNGANEWAQGGIMIRSNVEGDNGQYVALAMSKDHGWIRYADDGAAARVAPKFQSPGTIIPIPNLWFKITRVGNVFRFYTSTDGTAFTEIPSSSVTIAMPTDTFIGLYSAGVGQANGGLGATNNALQNQRLAVSQFSSVVAAATGTGVLNPPAFASINTFTPPTIGGSPTSTNNSVSISWNDVGGGQTETGYTVERSEDGVNWTNVTPTPLSGTTLNFTNNTGLHDSERYWYRVRSHSSPTTVSNPSNPILIATKPNAVSTFRNSTATASSITLHWDDVDGETGYKIYRSTSLNGTYTFVTGATLGANVTTYTNTGLSSNTTYYYKVETLGPSSWVIKNAVGVAVDTRWTNNAIATPGAGSVTSTSTSITIDWANFTSPAGVTGYLVYRGQAAAHTSFYTESPVGTPSSSVFTDNGLLPNTWYVYRIFAVNNGKISAPSAEIWKQTTASFARMSSGGSSAGSSSSLASSNLVMVNAPTSSKQSEAKNSSASTSVATKSSSGELLNAALSQVTQELNAKLPDSLVSLLATSKKEKRSNASNIFGELGSEKLCSFGSQE